MLIKEMPSQEFLKGIFDYRGGQLFWRTARSNGKIPAGSRAGGLRKHGYRTVWLGRQLYEHRVIWIWHNGSIPKDLVVDHINRDKSDNRIENLQIVTQAENCRDLKKRSLPSNVYRMRSKFQVQIFSKGVKNFLGTFDTINEAVAAREAFIK